MKAVTETFENYSLRHRGEHSYASGSPWIKVMVEEFVRKAYWGGLGHFRNYTEEIFDLVVELKYFDVFSRVACFLAPDQETLHALRVELLILEREKIISEWLRHLGKGKDDEHAFTNFRNEITNVENFLMSSYLLMPVLDPPPFSKVLNAEAF